VITKHEIKLYVSVSHAKHMSENDVQEAVMELARAPLAARLESLSMKGGIQVVRVEIGAPMRRRRSVTTLDRDKIKPVAR
jgi:hypothetical protein